jgi:repressor LexA
MNPKLVSPTFLAQLSPEEFGRFLRYLRLKQGKRIRDIARVAGLDPGYLSYLETGKRDFKRVRVPNLYRLLAAYGLPENYVHALLEAWSRELIRPPQPAPPPPKEEPIPEEAVPLNPYRLPIVEGGAGSPAWDDTQDFEYVLLPNMRGKEPLFGVRITGDSMEPLLYDGDLAIVWAGGPIHDKAIVAIGIPSNGIVVKHLYKNPLNPHEPPLMVSANFRKYPPEPLPEGAKVWGPVVAVVRSLYQGLIKRETLRKPSEYLSESL